MNIVLDSHGVVQPPAYERKAKELSVVIASLSLGGAEKIVLDWANRIYPSWKVHLIVLRDRTEEWRVPAFVRVTRVGGKYSAQDLRKIGKEIAHSGNPVCVCHLLSEKERNALAEGGAVVVPVLHNARDGWPEDSATLRGAPYTITVSESCEQDLREDGFTDPVTVIRHIPSVRDYHTETRTHYRREWRIPQDAFLIGMIGAVKHQKNYHFALKVLQALLMKQDAYLAIVGGPVNTPQGFPLWQEVVKEAERIGVIHRLAMPGFVHDAAHCLPTFDVMLNTSHYEGMSIATLEAIQSKTPIIASKVGGQGEVAAEGLHLIEQGSEVDVWVNAILKAREQELEEPSWAHFPSYRLWTLAGLARPFVKSEKLLFVTANLNSGGAQRSLVNLSKAIKGKIPFEIMIAGTSTSTHFFDDLSRSRVKVTAASKEWNSFSFAESLIEKICTERIGTVVFWNVDPRVKLLLGKMLSFTKVRFIDVSPGNFLYEEMDDEQEFQKFIAYSQGDFYGRLDAFVMKYHDESISECDHKKIVIRNGISRAKNIKRDYSLSSVPRVVMCGRIAPTKFVIEVIDAMKLVRQSLPTAELHIFGAAEHLHAAYNEEVIRSVGDEAGSAVIFHGPDFDVVSRMHEFDAYVVLGKNQGCPNALMEALSVGMPSVANNDGGTREQVIHESTGLLVETCDPEELSSALVRILSDRTLAQRLGNAGRKHIELNFSIELMAAQYLKVFKAKVPVFEKLALHRNVFLEKFKAMTKRIVSLVPAGAVR